jgi:hypothetical protein
MRSRNCSAGVAAASRFSTHQARTPMALRFMRSLRSSSLNARRRAGGV